MRYFLELRYNGAAYCGWQRQPDMPTVQQTLERALTTLLREPVEVTGAGRTDTGVNASYYVAHFDLGRPIAYRAADWCNYREKADGLWYDNSDLCPVAPVFRLGIYMINEVAVLMGDVEKVNVVESRIFTQRPTADNALLSVLHKNGVVGSIFASFCVNDLQHYKCSYEINYERGTIYKAVKPRNSETAGNKVAMQVVYTKDGKQYTFEEEITEASNYQWDVFYESIGGRKFPDLVSDDKIVAGIRMIELMKKEKMI